MENFLHLKKVVTVYFSKSYCKNKTKRKEKNFLFYLKFKRKKKKAPSKSHLTFEGLIFRKTLKEEWGA